MTKMYMAECKNELCCCCFCGVFEFYVKVCGGLIMHRHIYQTTYHIQYQEVTEILVFQQFQHKSKEFFRVVKVEIVRPTFALCDTVICVCPTTPSPSRTTLICGGACGILWFTSWVNHCSHNLCTGLFNVYLILFLLLQNAFQEL